MFSFKVNVFICLLMIYVSVHGDVQVNFGHHLKPLISQTGNVTVLLNSGAQLVLRCFANYPVEWVYDNDDTSRNSPNRRVIEWSDRQTIVQSSRTENEVTYDYISSIELEYSRLLEEEHLTCRSTQSHMDQLLIKITPDYLPSSQSQVFIYKEEGSSIQASSVASGSDSNSNDCGTIDFKFIQLSSGYYWQCARHDRDNNSSSIFGQIKFHDCPKATYCANKFRILKQSKSCITILNSTSINPLGWTRMNNDDVQVAGVAVCSIDNERRAIEYFFTGVRKEGQQRALHFSWSEIQPVDMIWLNSTIQDVYYTTQTLTTSCIVPEYGFSNPAVLIIRLNGSKILEENNFRQIGRPDNGKIYWYYTQLYLSKDVVLPFSSLGSGSYEIQCSAPVWNTTGWGNYTKSFIAKEQIPPYFHSLSENITFEDGEVNRRLHCDALGDPKPNKFSWDSANTPGSRPNGNSFEFSRIYKTWHDGAHITCTATNEFEQSAMKSLHIHVVNSHDKIDKNNSNNNEPRLSTTSIIVIIFGLIFGLLLIAGLLFLYFKFRKLDTQFASYLTNDEIKEFREGSSSKRSGTASPENDKRGRSYEEEDCSILSIECLPYNSAFEVMKQNLLVDFDTILGSGEYGIIYKGLIKSNSKDESSIPVAIKTIRKNVHVNYFKTLMSELKILAYIGNHENIVGLVGAYTANIKNRELYVGVELCKTSLLKYLQDNRHNFKDLVHNINNSFATDETSFSPVRQALRKCNQVQVYRVEVSKTFGFSITQFKKDPLTLKSLHRNYENQPTIISSRDLIQWSAQIASGMNFLSRKKVIHGDLATRNILLSNTRQAKICDFGLAKQLIDYNYIKSTSCPLPWKWMAIESLSHMTFSIKSDVWGYGVTVWEIFSLGQIPYPGLSWNLDFIEQLNSGLRLKKPRFADDSVYKMLTECWRSNPKERPSFFELKGFFEGLLQIKYKQDEELC